MGNEKSFALPSRLVTHLSTILRDRHPIPSRVVSNTVEMPSRVTEIASSTTEMPSGATEMPSPVIDITLTTLKNVFPSPSKTSNLSYMTMTNSTYTWASVLAMVPAPTPEEAQRYAVDVPYAELMERGTQIRSEKIVTDMLRFGGILGEFWSKATAAQKRDLLGFSAPLLKVFVYEGKKLADLSSQYETNTDQREVNRSTAIAIADQAYKEGMDERERLATALDGVADLEAGLEARIAAAAGRVTDFTTLSASIEALSNLAQEILSRPNSKAAKQLQDGGLDADQIAYFAEVATKVKTTGEQASGARAKGQVTQADLDVQDGICLALMARVMKVFNRAHERNPSIPRLVPIATRRMFVSARKPEVAVPEGEGT